METVSRIYLYMSILSGQYSAVVQLRNSPSVDIRKGRAR